nr:DUF898 family protein [Geotalea toluenoxydans]
MRYSSHRNIRFTFQPNYREAYLIFAGLPFLIPFTLGAIIPYMVYRQKKFFVENSGYGRNRCSFDATVKDFYLIFIKAAGLATLIISVFVACSFLLSTVFRDLSPLFLDGSVGKKTTQKASLPFFCRHDRHQPYLPLLHHLRADGPRQPYLAGNSHQEQPFFQYPQGP